MRNGNTANARECALSVLVACRRNGAWADAALKAQLGKCALSAQDAALCSRIVYGVMQNELLLNWYLSAYCTQKLDHLQPPLSDILRIGAYQILFLDKVPDHAAVSESVELCARTAEAPRADSSTPCCARSRRISRISRRCRRGISHD